MILVRFQQGDKITKVSKSTGYVTLDGCNSMRCNTGPRAVFMEGDKLPGYTHPIAL